jgi:outer membrane receptor protein involved in Fe transport
MNRVLPHLMAAVIFALLLPAWAKVQAGTPALYRIDLPPQPLDEALRELGRQAGVSIIFDPALARGRGSPPVQGVLTLDGSLQRLLVDTDLRAVRTTAGTVVIRRIEGARRTGVLPGASAARAVHDNDTVATILVTATRRDEALHDVPYNIQAITGPVLATIGARTAGDFVRFVPGLAFADQGNRDGVRFFLRGLRSGDEIGLAATTSTYIDDIPVDRPANFRPLGLKLLDLERIEVLRGPQGTLYGGGAIGGTIRYITAKPRLDAWEGHAGALLSGTSEGGTNHALTAMLNWPLSEGRAALRTAAGHYRTSGVLDNPVLGRHGIDASETLAWRSALRIEPRHGMRLDLKYHYERDNFGESSYWPSYMGEFQVDFRHPGSKRDDTHLLDLTALAELGWGELTSSTAYFRESTQAGADITALVRDGVYAAKWPDVPPFLVYNLARGYSQAWTQELRMVSRDEAPWSWIVGVYWQQSRVLDHFEERVPVPFESQAPFESWLGVQLNDDREFLGDVQRKFRQKAAFGEIALRTAGGWRLSLGTRVFEYDMRRAAWQIDQWQPGGRDAQGLARFEPLPPDRSYGQTLESGSVFRLNMSLDLSEDDLVYATIAQGYRPGGVNESTSANPVPRPYSSFKSDNIVSYEVGAKLGLLDGRGQLNSSIYFIDWRDIQTQIQTETGFGLRGNGGKAHAQGMELELRLRDVPVAGLAASVGYAYGRVELDETVAGIGFAGEYAPFVPAHSGSLLTDYTFNAAPGRRVGISFATTYTGASATDFGPLMPVASTGAATNPAYLKLDGYWQLNASIRLESGAWALRAFIENALDARADLDLVHRRSWSAYRPASFVERTVTRPRTVGFEINRNF